jgi:hypothetical protein
VAYLGNDLKVAYPTYVNIDDISGSFNGSTTSFALLVSGAAPVPLPLNSQQCLISVAGVLQRPDDTGAEGFRLSGGNIVFSSAPATGADFFGVILAGADYVNAGATYPDGSAAVPSITFDQDTDTGFYRSGSGVVSFSSNSVQAAILATTSLTAPSFIPTSSTVPTNGVYLPSANNVAISTNSQGRLFVNSSGNVGIGTTSPGASLDVNGKLRLSSTEDSQLEWVTGAQTWRSNVVSGGKWYLYDVTNAKFPLDVSANSTCKLDINTSHVAFTTNASERARIDSSGRLLVGTSTARSNFFNTTFATSIQLEGTTSVSSSLSLVSNRSTAEQFDQPVLVLGRSGGTAIGNNTVVANTNAVGSISFQGNDGTEFVALAEITAFVDGTPGANDMPGRLVFSTTADGASSPTERMRITNSGAILVNSTSVLSGAPFINVAFSASTNSAFCSNDTSASSGGQHFRFFSNGVQVGNINTTTTATAYATSSDYRLKENIIPLTGAIDRLQQIPVHRFNFIADPDNVVDGFLAHEAQEIVPECVIGTKDEVDEEGYPVYQGIDQSKLVPLLTAALQEAIGRIEALEAKVAALEAS